MDNNNELACCKIETKHLLIKSVGSLIANKNSKGLLIQKIADLFTPKVTQALPEYFQQVDDYHSASVWLETIINESEVLVILKKSSEEIIGFIFLSLSTENTIERTYYLGYLLGEGNWGKGFASEFLQYFLQWCKTSNQVGKLIAGVEVYNTASIKLLERHQFIKGDGSSSESNYFYSKSFA